MEVGTPAEERGCRGRVDWSLAAGKCQLARAGAAWQGCSVLHAQTLRMLSIRNVWRLLIHGSVL